MAKVIVITACDQCPHFNNQYYSYREECTELQRKIEGSHMEHPIPADCPLPDNTTEAL